MKINVKNGPPQITKFGKSRNGNITPGLYTDTDGDLVLVDYSGSASCLIQRGCNHIDPPSAVNWPIVAAAAGTEVTINA